MQICDIDCAPRKEFCIGDVCCNASEEKRIFIFIDVFLVGVWKKCVCACVCVEY